MNQVFQQAKESPGASNISDDISECYIENGIKICRFYADKSVFIYNTMTVGEFYQVLSESETKEFENMGWHMASLMFALKDASTKMKRVSELIQMDDESEPLYTKKLFNRLNTIKERWNRINTKLSLLST